MIVPYKRPPKFVIPLEDIIATVLVIVLLAGLTFSMLRWPR